MGIKNVSAEFEEKLNSCRRGRGSGRSVSTTDAAEMRANPGKWFEVETTASPLSARAWASALPNRLSSWYGGNWESRFVDGKLIARSVIQERNAA